MTPNGPTGPNSPDLPIRNAAETAAGASGLDLEAWLTRAAREPRRRASPKRGRKPAEGLESLIDRVVQASPPSGRLDARDVPVGAAAESRRGGADHVATSGALDSLADWIEQAAERQTRFMAGAAGPLDRLAEGVAALRRQLSAIEVRQVGRAELDALARALDDVRARVQRSEETLTARLPDRLDSLGRRLDRLASRPEAALEGMNERLADLAGSVKALAVGGAHAGEAIACRVEERLAVLDGRLAALAATLASPAEAATERLGGRLTEVAEQLEALARTSGKPVQALADRLERLAGGLSAPIQALAERLGDNLDAVAKPVEALTARMDQRLASLDARLQALAERVPAGADADRFEERLEAVAAHLAGLIAGAGAPADAAGDRIEGLASQITALAEQVGSGRIDEGFGRLSAQLGRIAEEVGAGQRPIVERLDRLEDGLRHLGDQADTAPLELMVRSLHERLERAAAGPLPLDGLEERLAAMLQRLTETTAEPVRQAFAETVTHVRGLRGEAAIIAERAARAVLKEMPLASAAEIDAVREGFAELKALQASAEKRTQATLRAVQNALEMLAARMPADIADREPPSDPPAARLEAAVRKLHAAAMAQAEHATGTAAAGRAEAGEIAHHPGARRRAAAGPGSSLTASPEAEPGSVRASFIAAARRAAQAAAAEAGSALDDGTDGESPPAAKAPISSHGLLERIRQTFHGGRRPLLSLALLLLATGSVQVAGGLREEAAPAGEFSAGGAPLPAAPAAAADPAPARDSTGSVLAAAGAAAEPGSEAAVAKPAEPGELPAGVPDTLRRAALAGDPAALFELATRLAEGRDLPRDLSLAARLFEKAAEAGLAPAQFQLANLFEKGVGVTRDLSLARSWYERAAAAGNTRAMHNLGVLFAEGTDGRPDYAAALGWFLAASEHGLRDSQFNLGVLLARGLGARQDLVQAYKWFALAAAADGDEDAGRKRDEVAARLAPADLQAAQALVAAWRPHPARPAANDVAPPPQGWSAAPADHPARRS